MKLGWRAAVVLMGGMALVGCNSGSLMSPGGTGPDGSPIGGTGGLIVGPTWRLTTLEGQPALGGTTVTAIFSEDARVAGSAGCNRYFGRAQAVDSGSVSIGPLGATLMACEADGVMTQEQRYLAALQAATSYSVEGEELRLGPSGSKVTLVFTMR